MGKGLREILRYLVDINKHSKILKHSIQLNVKDIQTKYGSGKVGALSDGTKVVAKQGSSTGGVTLEIKVSNIKVFKIRY